MTLCLLAVLLAAGVNAQVAEIENYPQGKAVAKTYEPQFIGCDGEHVYMIEMSGRLKNKMELVCYNMEQKELARQLMTEDKEVRCYGGYLNEGGVDLLMAHWEGNDMKVYRDRRDPQTLAPRGEQLVLADYKGTEGDKMGFAIGTSANKELLAGVYVVGREGQTTEVQVGLYGRELEEYWKVDARCRRLDFIHVTDSGEVLIGGYSHGEFNINVLDGERERYYSFEAEEKNLEEVALVRYDGEKIYLAASHSGREKYDRGTMVDYIEALCYDTRRGELTVDKHEITPVEYNRLYNQKDEAKVKKNDCRVMYMNLAQTLSSKDAGYVMFDQTWRVLVDGVPTTQNRLGMMVAKIGADGRFEWLRTFRISNIYSWPARMQASYRWDRTDGGLMLVWSEAKEKKELPEGKPVKDYLGANSAAMLTVLLLDGEGNMQRQHFELPSKQCLLGHPYRMEGRDYLLLIRGVSRGYFAKLSLKEN